MDKNKNGNAENPRGVYIYDRRDSKWLNQPRSGTLHYRDGEEKASDFHCEAMGKRCFLQQPQKFVNYDEQEGGIEPSLAPSMHDSDTNRRSSSRQFYRDLIDSQELENAFNHRSRRRFTPLIEQRQEPFQGNENCCQKYPYIPSPSSQIRNHYKEYSRHHRSGQLGYYTPNLSTVPIRPCTTTLPFITPQNISKEKFNSTGRCCYSYQQNSLSTSIARSQDDSSMRYDNFSNPKQRYGTLMPRNWNSRNSSDHNATELSSTKIWPAMYNVNQHSQPWTNQAPRPVNVAGRLKRSPDKKESDLVANVRKAESSGKEQIATIASQYQVSCSLPPIEVAFDSVVDYSDRTGPEVKLPTRSRKSSNRREPSPTLEEIFKAAEFANVIQVRPRQSRLHRTSGSQEGCIGGQKKVSYQSTRMVEEPVAPLTDHHSEQFSDENHSSRQSMRRTIESNEPEEKTKVKINGSRLSPHDLRVDLGKTTKTFSNHESLLGNSELQIGGEINSLLFIHRVMSMPCGVISFYVATFHITF